MHRHHRFCPGEDASGRQCNPREGFRRHLLAYLLVNTLLIAINLLTHPEHLWFHWPLLGWGIGLALHFFSIRRLDPG